MSWSQSTCEMTMRENEILRARLQSLEQTQILAQQVANAAEMFLAEYATEPQPHGGIGEDQIDGDTMAFHARRLLKDPLAAYRAAQPVAAQREDKKP
jgi:hypothetical protein